MKFISIQTGARRGYAVPVTLEKAGMLEKFYTDLAGNHGIGRYLSYARRIPWMGPALSRLASRKIPVGIIDKTEMFGSSALGLMVREAMGANTVEDRFRRQVAFGERWGRNLIRAQLPQATHIYSMLGESGPFLKEANLRGLTIVAEVFILLSTERILEKERSAFPDWEPDSPDYSELRRRYVKENYLLKYSHYFLCPSEAVQDDLVDNWGVKRDRTVLIPYGMSPHWLELEPQPMPGRILFVGTADLRKGIHYLAMAAELLKQKGRNYEFRIAGHVTDRVRQQSVCKNLNFLGRVPRDRIHEEFQKADVFVLPSLAEGSAEVTYEALAAGLPLVVTKAAGSVARDGKEGRIIPERDAETLADGIEVIVEDRVLREKYATASRTRARGFTWRKYGERLVDAIMQLKQ